MTNDQKEVLYDERLEPDYISIVAVGLIGQTWGAFRGAFCWAGMWRFGWRGNARQWPVVRRGGAIGRSGNGGYGRGAQRPWRTAIPGIMHVIVIMIGARDQARIPLPSLSIIMMIPALPAL